jgi:tetratricopeptide (TPR) repeat protein
LIGNAALAEGRSGDALTSLGSALHLCEPLGSSWHLATSLLNYGTALLNARRVGEAKPALERALAMYESLGDAHFTARTRLQLAYTALEGGDSREARRCAETAMRTIARLRDAWSIAEGLEALAAVNAADAPRESVVLAEAAARLRDRIGMLPHPQDAGIIKRQLELAGSRLPALELEQALQEGGSISLEEGVRRAIRLSQDDVA